MHCLYLLSCLTALLASVEAGAPDANSIVVKPPFLNLVNSPTFGTPVQVCLSKKPVSAVTVYVEAPNLGFSNCKVDFTPANWNKPQTIRIIPFPYLTPADKNRDVRTLFKASSDDPQFNTAEKKYQVVRAGGAGATCVAAGDPHFRVRNRSTYDSVEFGWSCL